MTKVSKSIGEKMLLDIIELCKSRLGSYEKLAEKLDLDPTVISHWKTGKRKPNHVHIMQMADLIGFEPYHVLCLVMEEIDTKNAELWKKWRPYGDSNPGYRRERAMSHIVFIFVKFCNFIPELVTLLKHHVNFLELDARIFALCEYPNDRAKLTHDREERLVSPKN